MLLQLSPDACHFSDETTPHIKTHWNSMGI